MRLNLADRFVKNRQVMQRQETACLLVQQGSHLSPGPVPARGKRILMQALQRPVGASLIPLDRQDLHQAVARHQARGAILSLVAQVLKGCKHGLRLSQVFTMPLPPPGFRAKMQFEQEGIGAWLEGY